MMARFPRVLAGTYSVGQLANRLDCGINDRERCAKWPDLTADVNDPEFTFITPLLPDFRYSNRSGLGVNDRARADKLLKGIVGKRLTYRRPDETAHALA
jgi:hypothetical protein